MTTPHAVPTAAVDAVARYLSRRMGLSFAGARRTQLLREVAHAMALARVPSGGRYCARLEEDESEFDALVARVTVGESYFFREPGQIELLRRTVLPERRRARGPSGPLRLWSAGCAGGQEAYTLAILAEEEGLAGRARIEATDISNGALRMAKAGLFGRWALRAVTDSQRAAYFTESALGFRVDERFARAIDFRTLNLLDPSQPVPRDIDVVVCRNVLIYFTPEAVDHAARRLAAALAPGGWLVMGSSDPLLHGIDGLEPTSSPAGLVYRRPSGTTATQSAPSRSAPSRSAPSRSAPARSGPLPARRRFPPRAEPAFAPEEEQRQTPDEAVATIRSLGGCGELAGALDNANRAVARFPLSPELRYLQAVVAMESGRPGDAAASARAALYLDPKLVVAHLALARAEAALDRPEAAVRSLRTAAALLGTLPADAVVPMSDGEPAGRLAAMAAAQGKALVRTRAARSRANRR